MKGRLVKKGLVGRRMDKLDRRRRPVVLTRIAKRLVMHVAMLADVTDDEFFGRLQTKMRRSLM
jgi:DNA-binding MarR family transcriptional regulator